MSPAEARDTINAFLASPAAATLEGLPPQDVRAVLERFELCLTEDFEAGLESLDGGGMHALIGHALPERFARGEPLAQRVGPVLRAYLDFQEPQLGPALAMELRAALDGTLDEFLHCVRTGENAHHHGGHEHHGPLAHPFVRAAPKVGRNDPCPCGSGRKFKQCCA